MRLLKNRSIRFYLVFFVILAMTIGGSAFAAFADSPSTQVAVNAGTLSETGPASVSATAVTLNGTNLTTTYTLGIAVNDDTGTGNGWNLTITSTQFSTGASCGAGHTLSTGASTITGVASAVNGAGTYTNPSNNISNTSLGLPAACPAPTAVKFFNATANTGMGHFTITPTISIAIPANAYAGTYTSTVTLAVVSGP